MPEPIRQSHALEAFLARMDAPVREAAGLTLDVLAFRGYLNLRGDAADAGFLEAVAKPLGQPLPLVANTFSDGACRVYWLGPDEWLIITEPEREQLLAAQLTEALTGRIFALTDLTGGQISLRLSGTNARDVLATGCTLDFHPRVFQPGQCAQTMLGKVSMLIGLLSVTDDGGVFEIVVRRTFAEYAARWLQRGARRRITHEPEFSA